MWVMVPDSSTVPNAFNPYRDTRTFHLPIARSGIIRGEVGLVVANARMYDEAIGTITGTFAFWTCLTSESPVLTSRFGTQPTMHFL
jgi:hypothetical protein